MLLLNKAFKEVLKELNLPISINIEGDTYGVSIRTEGVR